MYITTAVTDPAEGKTINMTSPGYYYYDDDQLVWIKIGSPATVDITNDAWINNDDDTAKRVELGTLADGVSPRPLGTDFIINDNGSVGIGTKNNTSILDVIGGNSVFNAGINVATSDVDGAVKFGIIKTSGYFNQGPPILIAGLINLEAESVLGIGGGFGTGDSSPSSIVFVTDYDDNPATPGGSMRMSIKPNGYVHVGQQLNPRSKFSLDGTIGASISVLQGPIGEDHFTVLGSGDLTLPNGNYSGRIYNILYYNTDFTLSTSGPDTILDAGNSTTSLNISASQPRITVQNIGNQWVVIAK